MFVRWKNRFRKRGTEEEEKRGRKKNKKDRNKNVIEKEKYE